MLEKIKTILLKFTEVEEISEKSTLTSDLGMSSFDIMSIIMEFENEFGIEILDKDIKKLITVKDIIDYLQEKL